MALDLVKFKQLIVALHEETLRTIELTKASSKTVVLDQNSVGRLSRIDAMQGQAMALANTQRQQNFLRELEAGLNDIESGEFGRCKICDKFIATARLELSPTAQHCVDCAAAIESR